MPKVQIVTRDKAQAAPDSAPGVKSSAYFSGERQSLHLHMHELAPGAALIIAAEDADCAIYVWRGEVRGGGAALDERSSAIVEHGQNLQLTAGPRGATLLSFNAGGNEQNPRAGGHVHLLPNARVPRTQNMDGEGKTGGALHADAACPTCQVWLHENDFFGPDREVDLHSHSEDEIIFVRAGQMKLGGRLYEAGMALAIAADTKYGFSTGPDGLSFVNFRISSPTYSNADGTQVLDEAQLWRSIVGAPQYLSPSA